MTRDFDLIVDVEGRNYYVEGRVFCVYADDSFSHEFGISHRGHWIVEDYEVKKIEDIDEDVEIDWENVPGHIKDVIVEEILRVEVN